MVQSTLNAISDRDLRAYIVWEPIRPWDSIAAARASRTLVSDPRATHFWANGQDLAVRTQPAIGLAAEPAWDVYLLYARGATWTGNSVPRPADFLHQLGGRLPDENLLQPDRLTARVSALVLRDGHP